MADLRAPLRLGANCWNQYAEWPAFLAAQQRADALGFDSLWTWDHLYPIVGPVEGPIFECYTAMAAVAASTERATIGMMVGANTFREPALVAKMVTTLDHISGGRAVLGIGAAWFDTEHRAFGIPFGSSPGERLRWLGEALPILRGMLDGTRPSAPAGSRYSASDVINLPAPLQRRVPILIGGSGRRVTLRLVAGYADACNIGGPAEHLAEKEATLVAHCAEVGRDEREIERTVAMGTPSIRDGPGEAQAALERIFAGHGGAAAWQGMPVGTVDEVVAFCAPFVRQGYRHLVFGFPSPYDEETMTRLATEVRPRLEAMIEASPEGATDA
jgi:alkanesulfonate monooxygenase SsuD/methylene tetrahydromethanopterin reductase-like flavin-dependent oxidoreductase (luciferase family)